MKRYVLLVLGLFVSGAMAFAGGESEVAATEAEPTTIEFWAWATSDKEVLIERAIEEFYESQNDLRVEFSAFPSGGYQERILTAVASDSAPDVSFTQISMGQRFASEGVLADMNELGAESMLDGLLASSLPYGQYEGGTYMLPVNADNRFIAYNRDIIEEAGHGDLLELDALTWEELVQLSADTATVDDNGDVRRIGLYVAPNWGSWADFLYTAGGSILTEDYSRANFNNDAGLQALELLLELREYSTTLQDEDSPFYNGQVAMIKKGSWDLPRFPVEMPDTEWGIMPFPTPDGRVAMGAGSLLAGIDIGIYESSEHKEEAFQLVEHFLSDDVQSWFPAEYGQFPVVMSAYQTEEFAQYTEEFPQYAQAAELMQYTWPLPLIPEWGRISEILNDHVEQAWFGEMEPDDALAEAEAQVNALLDE